MPCALAGSILFSNAAWAAQGTSTVTTVLGPIAVGWILSVVVAFKKPKLGTLLAGLIGTGIALYLGFQHDVAAGASACNVSSEINCDLVNRSEYSEIFGFPIAFLGAAFYASVVGMAFTAFANSKEYRLGGKLLLVTGAFATLYSIYLAYVSKFVIGAWCLYCIGMYGINAILILCGWLWDRQAKNTFVPSEEMSQMGGYGEALLGKNDASLGSLSLYFFIGLIIFGAMSTGSDEGVQENVIASSDQWYLVQPEGVLALDGSEPVYGNPDARYTIVEFADFECPYCGMIAPKLKSIVDENPEVKLLFKHYPISSLCNEHVAREGHTNACGTAAAADCAGEQGLFWEFSSMAFKNQKFLTKEDRLFLAEQVKLDLDAFQSCVDQDSSLAGVKSDIVAADKVGLQGTPSLYLKGIQGLEWARIDGAEEELSLVIKRLKRGDVPPTVLPKAESSY